MSLWFALWSGGGGGGCFPCNLPVQLYSPEIVRSSASHPSSDPSDKRTRRAVSPRNFSSSWWWAPSNAEIMYHADSWRRRRDVECQHCKVIHHSLWFSLGCSKVSHFKGIPVTICPSIRHRVGSRDEGTRLIYFKFVYNRLRQQCKGGNWSGWRSTKLPKRRAFDLWMMLLLIQMEEEIRVQASCQQTNSLFPLSSRGNLHFSPETHNNQSFDVMTNQRQFLCNCRHPQELGCNHTSTSSAIKMF